MSVDNFHFKYIVNFAQLCNCGLNENTDNTSFHKAKKYPEPDYWKHMYEKN